jgi:hypothetical protein
MEDMSRLSKKLKETTEFLNKLGQYLDENFKIVGAAGKGYSIEEWKEYFLIDIPDEVTFPVLVDLAAQIFEKYQRAAYFRDKQTIQMSILDQTKAEKYHSAYQDARKQNEEKFNKPLAAESCKVAATVATKELEDAISNQKVVRDFWNKTCDTLTELRKLLELMGYALSGDARVNRDFVVRSNGRD